MRWKVPSSNTGSDDSAKAAAERDSGVLAGFTAACGGFAATGGLAATAGLGGVPKPCASACPAASARMTPATEMIRINPLPSSATLPIWRDFDELSIRVLSLSRVDRFEVISSSTQNQVYLPHDEAPRSGP